MQFRDTEESSAMDVTKGREVLPKNVKPTHYNVELEPDLEQYTYNGSIDIEWVLSSRSRKELCRPQSIASG